ncbi:28S ribosomal protein S14, mitochondrial [Holothuria leucospilota]|uniref:28S ribosomal protein S14, mitochondrial n=1 Tax=Holothuria leucospilota TaxID=206669 RepID=A0A9Q0YFB3_HOLLE|nr:28S ribosomal protein S14, mitochondrial [Holothuria leucospilota]
MALRGLIRPFCDGIVHRSLFLSRNLILRVLFIPERTRYTNWRMRRDAIRRQMVKDLAVERIRLNCIRKNTVLPDELRQIADVEIAAQPRDSNYIRVRDRCAITSRPRSVIPRWRLSRIQWRAIADACHMSGVKRASW